MRIAMVAMSGLRTYDPELLRLGMTLPGFVERGRAIASLPSLSLLTLAALTPDVHDVTYHEVEDIAALGELPDCDLAAISTFTAQAKDAYAVSQRFRSRGAKTVIGGLHVTAVPDEAARYADTIVIGEGEAVWNTLVSDAASGRMRPIYDARTDDVDLARVPVPRYDLLDAGRYNRLTVQTSRGCPWRCEFCASSILLTPRYKLKPVENVAAEIMAMKAIWARPFVEFADDNTFVDKRRSRALMDAVGEQGVRWFTETDVSVADDIELLQLMHESGCAEVLIGFESPTADGVHGIELRRDWKRTRLDGYIEAIERIQSHGIAVNACFVLGMDGDGPEIFEAVESFVERARPFDVQITVLTPLPGTPVYGRFLSEGRILHDREWERYTLFDVTYRPRRMSVDALERGLRDLVGRLYAEDATRRRRRAFVDQWRRGRRRGAASAEARSA